MTLDPEPEVGEAPLVEAERSSAPRSRPNFDEIRADIQRNFAAHMDLGIPDPAPPPPPTAPAEPERVAVAPRVERRRVESLRAEVQKNATVKIERRRPFSNLRITPTRLALVLVALLAGGLAAYLATQHDQPAAPAAIAQSTPADPPPVPKVQVLVAKQAVEMGQRLSATSIGWEDWPQDSVKPEYVTIATAPQAITDMTGSVARSEILAGEPIRKERLAAPGSGYLSAMLGNGMRGVSVSVTADSASGGFVVPNDHVDVVLTRSINGAQSSETILRDVRVLRHQYQARTDLAGSGADQCRRCRDRGVRRPGDRHARTRSGAVGSDDRRHRHGQTVAGAAPDRRKRRNRHRRGACGQRGIRLTSPFWTKP